MYVIIAGCRRVGASLAMELAQENHDVVVIDSDPVRLSTLGTGFNGVTIVGMPIDEDVLRNAGVEQADALVAVTDDDNMNIMVSQVAREIFSVPTVVTRLYSPQQEAIMSTMGLTTVCPTTLAVRQIKRCLLKQDILGTFLVGDQKVSFCLVKPQHKLINKPLIEAREEPVMGLYRDRMLVPYTPREIIRPDDLLAIAVFEQQEV
jgi:trk system potassium uptake protein TrkA